MHTCIFEGINNKIKRMAFSDRDTDYFFFKIRAAFRANPRRAKIQARPLIG